MPHLRTLIDGVGLLALGLAACYSTLLCIAVVCWKAKKETFIALPDGPAITLLKPLCGVEPGLYDNLRSFCEQDYPRFQIVVGMCDATDPAIPEVVRLIDDFPGVDIELVVCSQQHGSNRKISSLINMLERARHDVLVMADSDARVGNDYLTQVTAPLRDPQVGLVSCLYDSIPTGTIWSRLGAMYVNEWYMPSVILAWMLGHRDYVSGQTICVRRSTLQAIGGLRGLADYLADDYQLGELIRKAGLRIVLSHYRLKAVHHEPTFLALVRHESRWMRTIYVLKPWSFRFLFLSFSMPVALVGIALAGSAVSGTKFAWPLFGVVILSRLTLHFVYSFRLDPWRVSDVWLIVFRDLLLCAVWYMGLNKSRITWRGSEFKVGSDGIMKRGLLDESGL